MPKINTGDLITDVKNGTKDWRKISPLSELIERPHVGIENGRFKGYF